MIVLILANNDTGLYKFRKELIEKLCKDNSVYIALPYGELIEPLKKLGCEYIQFEFNRRGTNPIADVMQVYNYVKLMNKLKPDVVLTYTIKPNVYGGIACQITKTPYLSNITGLGTALENGGFLGWITKTLYKRGLSKSKCVFFQNSDNMEMFMTRKIVKGKTRLIPGSGVNLSYHSYVPYPEEQKDIRFLFVGRLMKDKGIGELLEAIEDIRKDNENVTLDIVGWSDENYDDVLLDAQQRGDIRYHGMQTDVRPFYALCHCVVLPSYHEGTANVLLEASATGRPVIATKIPGCKETFSESVTGFGCEVKNVDSLCEAIKKFIKLSPTQRERMGLAAREKIEKEYDRNLVIAAYQEEIGFVSDRLS